MPIPSSDFYLTDSARGHGFDERDVADVFAGRPMMLRSRRGQRHVYEFLGRNRAGAYLHVVARMIESSAGTRWRVFHANLMPLADRRRYQRWSTR